MDQTMNERVCAEINLDHARMNMQALCREAAPAEVMAVVKANGYGHGAVDCGRAFVEGGATWLAVATVDEAIELQDAGIDAKILILSLVEEPRETDALSRGFRVVVGDTATGRRLATKAKQLGIQAPVHLKLDTGMSRIGFDARTDASEQIRQLVQETHDSLSYEGLMTHFACSDADDRSITDEQYERFHSVRTELQQHGIDPPIAHVCNSAATLRFPEYHLDLVRVGLIAYGMSRSNTSLAGIKPVMTFVSRVAYVKNLESHRGIGYGHTAVTDEPRRIATVSVGYADGYKRALGGRSHVSIHGTRYPVVGRICMDALMVDVGPALPEGVAGPVQAGDRVLLWGESGGEQVPVEELAAQLDTIPYELVCGVSARVPRHTKRAKST